MMTSDKTVFVDIDNTLWQFCDQLHDRMRQINPAVTPVDQWTDWHFFQQYMTDAEFWQIINDIHSQQDHDEHVPYPEAKGFLQTLRQHGYSITIASHRSPEYLVQTENWLKRHGLVYDDIHLSFHKTDLINDKTTVVVDDSPQVLEKAVEHGAAATGLLFPWNRAYSNNGFKLCSNLDQILEIILSLST